MTDGCIVELPLGTTVGDALGLIVVFADGSELCISVGVTVGDEFGLSVRGLDGLEVGLSLGPVDNFNIGRLVGENANNKHYIKLAFLSYSQVQFILQNSVLNSKYQNILPYHPTVF